MPNIVEQIVRIETDGDETRAEVVGELVRCSRCVYGFTGRCVKQLWVQESDGFCSKVERKEVDDAEIH